MTHRDVRVSLYGVVVGVILGAGALAYAQHAALQASASVGVDVAAANFHGSADPADFTRRAVDRKGVPIRSGNEVNSYPTVKTTSSSSVSSAAVMTPSTMCDAVDASLAKVQAVYNAVIPMTFKNTDIRQKMDSAFADAWDDFCVKKSGSSSSSEVSVSSPSVPKVDNHCEKYPVHTARYTQCVISGENGKKFP